MKLNLEINGKPFKETMLFNVLYVVLVTVRVFFVVAILFMPSVVCRIVFPLLGVKNTVDKIINLWEGLSFLGDKP